MDIQESGGQLEVALRASWDADTSWLDEWDPLSPAKGQCGSSALVALDHLGGGLLSGLVDVGGPALIVHHWGVRPDGRALDYTWGQFPEGARVVRAKPVARTDLLPNRWFVVRYELLATRVANHLGLAAPAPVALSRPA